MVEDADGEFANDEDATNSGMILGILTLNPLLLLFR